MNRLLILLLFIGLNLASTQAINSICTFDPISLEQKPDPVEKLIKNLTAKVSLTAEQTQQVRAIAAKYDFQAVSGKELRTLRRDLKKEIMTEVLTEEQKESFRKGRG